MSKRQTAIISKAKRRLAYGINVLIGAIVLIMLFNLFLYARMLIGNDILVTLSASNESINVARGQLADVEFEIKVKNNPFCKAECSFLFEDISNNTLLEQSKFILKSSSPMTKRYTLTPKHLGKGMELYRFTTECKGIRTKLCHTAEQPATRSVIVTLDYTLSDNERSMRENLKEWLEQLLDEANLLVRDKDGLEQTIGELNNKTALIRENLLFKDAEKNNKDVIRGIYRLKEYWDIQDYQRLSAEKDNFTAKMLENRKEIDELNEIVETIRIYYNSIIDRVNKTRERLQLMQKTFITDNGLASRINESIIHFNNLTLEMKKTDSLSAKEVLLSSIEAESINLESEINNSIMREANLRDFENYLNADLLCRLVEKCIEHPAINRTVDLKSSCEMSALINGRIAEINSSENHTNYTEKSMKELELEILQGYLDDAEDPEMVAIIEERINRIVIDDSYVNEILLIEECNQAEFNYEILTKDTPEKAERITAETPDLLIRFEEQGAVCCVFGKCERCCTDECYGEPEKYPVVFIHGHAVSEDVSAEYSLEGLSRMQQKIEENGYVDAGAFSSYHESKENTWSMIPLPVSIRASYYFDVFQEESSSVMTQAKSENIDTYAVRLKEAVDEITARTGREKAKLICYSMGGLVCRRYIQLFTEKKVESLILIGVPNKGVTGKISRLCPVFGGKLECHDLDSESIFINKLNGGAMPNISVYNIVGTGCQMDEGMGDGIVLEESAMLEGAKNFVINSSCKSAIETLHLDLLDTKKYPEVEKIVLKGLGTG
ncbi:hypothetical protein JXA85_01715 [Candidatus Woesearchaeota archaeon]|nr:hypothetical protein [Candidatus Woesearchaeota archaeon]